MTDRQPNLEDLMRIDDPDFDRVLECVFGILPHESRTYFALVEKPGSTAAELAEDLERDRSSVNRSLTALVEADLIERDRKLLGGGGYVYQYFPTPIPEARATMHTAVQRWAGRVHDQIDSFAP